MADRLNEQVERIARGIVQGVRERVGAEWDDFSAGDRQLLEASAKDMAMLQIRSIGVTLPDVQMQLLREKAHVQAQLCNLSCANALRVQSAFWQTVKDGLSAAVAIAFAAL